MTDGVCVQVGTGVSAASKTATLASLATTWGVESRMSTFGYCIQVGTGSTADERMAVLDGIAATWGADTSTCDWATGCC